MADHIAPIHYGMPASIDVSALPQDEHQAANSINWNILQLKSSAEEFRSSLELLLYVESTFGGMDQIRRRAEWTRIACRNGAIVAHGFWMGMQAINATAAPTVWSKANMKARNKATKLFSTEFPTLAKIRKSAAHPVELSATDAEASKHRLKAPFEGLSMSIGEGSFVQGGVHVAPGKAEYHATFDGQLVSYTLCEEKAYALEEVANLYNQTFWPLEAATAAARRELLQQTFGPRW